MNAPATEAPRWWVPGDWNGFFGLFTNVVLNVIVLTGLCLHVVNLPADIVYGRILPAPRDRLAARQSLLRLACVASRQDRAPRQRHRNALRAIGAAHVYRRLSDHAADLLEDA